jgi:hypothetical protein
MLRPRDIKLTARKYLPEIIKILDGPAASPEHRMVAQYDEIAQVFDTLGSDTFVIGRMFLQDLSAQDPENITLKCLMIINGSAFEEPSEADCRFLEDHGPAQAQYGLNVYLTVIDGWTCMDRPEQEIDGLKALYPSLVFLTDKDIGLLKKKFKLAGVTAQRVEAETQSFIALCQSRKIQTPGVV